jgi:hypothetical protein
VDHTKGLAHEPSQKRANSVKQTSGNQWDSIVILLLAADLNQMVPEQVGGGQTGSTWAAVRKTVMALHG